MMEIILNPNVDLDQFIEDNKIIVDVVVDRPLLDKGLSAPIGVKNGLHKGQFNGKEFKD